MLVPKSVYSGQEIIDSSSIVAGLADFLQRIFKPITIIPPSFLESVIHCACSTGEAVGYSLGGTYLVSTAGLILSLIFPLAFKNPALGRLGWAGLGTDDQPRPRKSFGACGPIKATSQLDTTTLKWPVRASQLSKVTNENVTV